MPAVNLCTTAQRGREKCVRNSNFRVVARPRSNFRFRFSLPKEFTQTLT
jgi:hypothetical protein